MLAKTVSPGDDKIRCRAINTSQSYVVVHSDTPLGIAQEVPRKLISNSNVKDVFSNVDINPVEKIDFSKSALSKPDQAKFKKFLQTKAKAFATHDFDLGHVTGLSGKVCDTGDANPIRRAPYRIPVVHKDPLDAEINKMLKAGLIEPAPQSAWASPVILVKKKNSTSLRLVNDYRKVNEYTKTISFPLPHQDSIKEMLAGNGLYTTIDLQKAYWQVALDNDSDRDRSAFVTYKGVYRYRVIPFGWKNSPQVFQRSISTILNNLQWVTCQCFLDDILVFSKNDVDEHMRRVGAVLDRFIDHGMKINPAKSSFARNKVQYLGNVYDTKGSQPTTELVDKIKRFPAPHDLKTLRQALGMFNFYRSYIPFYSAIAKPLLMLLKQDQEFKWTSQCESSFQALKQKLTEFPVLRYPDFTKPFYLHTDASGFAIGSQLCQLFEDGQHPIAYHSRVLNKAETNYSTYEREGLAIVDACKHFRHFILGYPVTVLTDHSPLRWLLHCDHKSSRLARFALKLQEYDIKVVYKPGKQNVVPDALSRVKIEDACVVGATELHLSSAKYDLLSYGKLQREDSFWSQIMDLVRDNIKPDNLSPTQNRHVQNQRDNYFLQDGVLYYNPGDSIRPLLCVPEASQVDLLHTYHASLFSCHVGRSRTYKRLKHKYFWLGMSNSVAEFIESCVQCNQRKRGFVNPRYPLQPIECEHPFSRVSMDILGPLPLTLDGNKYILAFQCSFTKLVIARPVANHTAETVANEFLEYVILPHGVPSILLSDNAPEFNSQLLLKLTTLLKIDKRTCTPYMPTTDGQIERFFSTFSNLISTVINKQQNDWDRLTKYVVHSYNNTEHASTGFTPTYLTYGRDITIPFELCVPLTMPRTYCDDKDMIQIMTESLAKSWALARDNIEHAQVNYKHYHDLLTKGHNYEVGDTVYVYVPRVTTGLVKKFTSKYHGPYVITKLTGLNAYVRALGTAGVPVGVEFITHLQRLKKAKSPVDFTPATYVSVKKPRQPEEVRSTPQEVKTKHSYNLRNRK